MKTVRIILGCIIAIIIQYLSDIIGFMGSSVMKIFEDSPFFTSFCLSLFVALSAYILVRYGALRIFKIKFAQLRITWSAKFLFTGILYAIVVGGLLFLFTLFFSSDVICHYDSDTSLDLWKVFWDYGISTGFSEELIFRGFLLVFLLNFMQSKFAVALSSIVFVLPHLFISSDIIEFVTILITDMALAILMAMLYLKSGSLLTPISFHAAINFITTGLWNESTSNSSPDTLLYTNFCDSIIPPGTIIFALVALLTNIYLINHNHKESKNNHIVCNS